MKLPGLAGLYAAYPYHRYCVLSYVKFVASTLMLLTPGPIRLAPRLGPSVCKIIRALIHFAGSKFCFCRPRYTRVVRLVSICVLNASNHPSHSQNTCPTGFTKHILSSPNTLHTMKFATSSELPCHIPAHFSTIELYTSTMLLTWLP